MSPWMLILSLLPCLVFVKATVITGTTDQCSLKNSQTYREVEQCVEVGENFIRKYLRHIQREKKTDKCRTFADFEHCLDRIFTRCPNLRDEMHTGWVRVYDGMKCGCNNSDRCPENLQCFNQEYRGRLISRCDDHFRFNRRQRTRHICHHIRENINCKEALVSSACGNETGEFAFQMFKLGAQSLSENKCNVTRDTEYKGFRYSERCPANFVADMESCGMYLSQDKRLEFHGGNDLIALKKKNVPEACRNFKNYERCVRDHREMCPEGTEHVYNYVGPLRAYLLKMNFICGEQKENYISNLRCYKRVVNNVTSACDHVWKDIEPKLQRMSAYEFYCEDDDVDIINVRSSLDNLVLCYQEVFTNHCSTGGRILGDIMAKAFIDPYYLQFDFKPDCDYHRQPPTDPPPNRPTEAPPDYNKDVPGAPPTKTLPNPNNRPPAGSSQTESRASQTERSTGGAVTLSARTISLAIALVVFGVIR